MKIKILEEVEISAIEEIGLITVGSKSITLLLDNNRRIEMSLSQFRNESVNGDGYLIQYENGSYKFITEKEFKELKLLHSNELTFEEKKEKLEMLFAKVNAEFSSPVIGPGDKELTEEIADNTIRLLEAVMFKTQQRDKADALAA